MAFTKGQQIKVKNPVTTSDRQVWIVTGEATVGRDGYGDERLRTVE